MKSALLVNPRSGESNRKGLELARMLAGSPSILVRTLEKFGQLGAILEEFAAAGVTDLFISSGDGTVHAIQTDLAERKLFPVLPRLCLLPHGTTNMTAADLGFRRRNLAVQAAFIAAPQPQLVHERATIRVANPRDGRVRHGMFLGSGAAWRATVFCQEAIHRTGLRGDAATFATLASAVVKSLASRAGPSDPDRIDRPYEMKISAGGDTKANGGHLLVLATTLEKLILGTRPFWGGKNGPIRATILPFPVPSLVRWLVPMMYGSEMRSFPPGAVSFSAETLDIETRTPFVVDGEFFEPPQDAPLRIETGPVFTYLCA